MRVLILGAVVTAAVRAAVRAAVVATTLATMLGGAPVVVAAEPTPLELSVRELRESVGTWNVTTEFLNPDGTVANTAEGTYAFEWVVPDRVLSGVTDTTPLGRTSAILFYVNEAEEKIEMVSVGGDGKLWIINGPLGGNTRMTQSCDANGWGTGQLRFTRYNVEPDRFESRMEYTTDQGETWVSGNHQTFRRAEAAPSDAAAGAGGDGE